VRWPDLRASASLVSMSSPSIWAIRITISSTEQSSYRWGSILVGAVAGFGRFARVEGLCGDRAGATLELPGPCEFLLLVGDIGWGGGGMLFDGLAAVESTGFAAAGLDG
jgi:hypothetical protein